MIESSAHTRLNLTWSNVNVIYKPTPLIPSFMTKYKTENHILKNQIGKVSSGELVGLIGSSGSGKLPN
jgi:ABC-type multidrug transport system ATPase subunit